MEKQKEKKSTRRKFLKWGAAGVAAAAATGIVGCAEGTVSAVKDAAKGKKLGMAIDLDKCYGCQACQVACKAEFDVPLGVFRSKVDVKDTGNYPKVKRSIVPKLCNHCDNPVCVKVCPVKPVKATKKRDDGVVVIDKKLCIGCGSCVDECPYNARYVNEDTEKADKCDLCLHRVENGVVPSCVNTCPAQARVFGDLNDPKSAIAKLVGSKSTDVLEPKHGTKPQIRYIGLG